MSDEKKINQELPQSESIEDVFSNVDSTDNDSRPSVPQEQTPQGETKENMNISESSIGQEEVVTSGKKVEKPVREPQVYNGTEQKGQGINTNKIFFYLILALIVLLGVFAIWALVF